MRGARCAVIGFGRIGRALTELLVELGAETAVVSGSPEKRSGIEAAGGRAYTREEMQAAIHGRDFIFSTPPAQVLGKEALSAADADARIIDLASPPYGVDLDAARLLNLRAWRESGLPGRYCPLSAAQAILNAVRRWEEAELHG